MQLHNKLRAQLSVGEPLGPSASECRVGQRSRTVPGCVIPKRTVHMDRARACERWRGCARARRSARSGCAYAQATVELVIAHDCTVAMYMSEAPPDVYVSSVELSPIEHPSVNTYGMDSENGVRPPGTGIETSGMSPLTGAVDLSKSCT